MSEEKKSEVKEARKLSMKELEQVTGGVFALCIGKTVVGGDEEIVE